LLVGSKLHKTHTIFSCGKLKREGKYFNIKISQSECDIVIKHKFYFVM